MGSDRGAGFDRDDIVLFRKFLKGGITTVPQFLELRYDRFTQSMANFIFLIAYAFLLLPIILYSGAVGLSHMMDLQALTGRRTCKCPETIILWLTVLVIGVLGLLYSRFGTTRYDQRYWALVGGIIAYFALNKVSGGEGIIEGWSILREAAPERLSSIGKSDQSVPFSTLFTVPAEFILLVHQSTNYSEDFGGKESR